MHEILVDYDELPDAINQIKRSIKFDLIVMGTNGITGAKEVVFGSNTINVIRKVDCPTLVVPEDFKYRAPKDILLPLDLKDSLSDTAFKNVIKFTKDFGEKLHLLRITPNNKGLKEIEQDTENIDSFLGDTLYEYHIMNKVPMTYAVDAYIQSNSIDLTTLLVQKESLFERFFIGSPTTKISNNIRVPLLIFHA